jgi:hypothetical protein
VKIQRLSFAYVAILAAAAVFGGAPCGLSAQAASAAPAEPLVPTAPVSAADAPVPEGIAAKLSQVLAGKARNFRQADFEVYRWVSDPQVVVLDFTSLEIQDLYVKRLVFFLEKAGSRRQLVSDTFMKGKDGWKANDFSPESLARFYNAARQAAFPLNTREEYFLRCLLAWGLLSQDGKGFLPGRGAIVSIAQDSLPATRKLLLQHEMTHGIYFTTPTFRDYVAQEWKALPAEPKSFLLRFFQFKRYDTSDAALMINEFQAYLLQQPLGALQDYVTRQMVVTFKTVYRDDTEFEARAKANAPELQKAAKRLAAWLKEHLGIDITDLTK